jgi:hypothetical protein
VRTALKPTQTPPPMPAATGGRALTDDPELFSRNVPSVFRAPSLPGPMRLPEAPPPRRAVPAADDHPTEVMPSEGPDAELLATAAAVSQRAVLPPVTLPVPPSPPPSPPPGFQAPMPDSLRPPRARQISLPAVIHDPEAERSSSPDVTSRHTSVVAPAPKYDSGPLLVAVGVGVVVGLAGAIALLLVTR